MSQPDREARSRNSMPIRLPDERWIHLTEGYSEMVGYYSEVLVVVFRPNLKDLSKDFLVRLSVNEA